MRESAIGGTWDELEKEIFTPEEIMESNLRVAVIGKIINARQKQEFSLKNLSAAPIEKF